MAKINVFWDDFGMSSERLGLPTSFIAGDTNVTITSDNSLSIIDSANNIRVELSF